MRAVQHPHHSPASLAGAHENFVAFYRALANALPGSRCERWEGGVEAVATGLPAVEYNRLFVTERVADAREVIARGRVFFDALRLPWTLTAAPGPHEQFISTAFAAGLSAGRAMPLMVLGALPAGSPTGIPGLEIERVADAALAREFTAALEIGNDALPGWFRVFGEPGAWDAEGVSNYIGWFAGEPVAVAGLCVTGATAGIYNVATVPAFRRAGFGRALTAAALADARAGGCTEAVLQSSNAGLPLYRAMGFEACGAYRTWYAFR